MDGSSHSILGCPAGFWNLACCSSFSTCDACNAHRGYNNCQWCGEGSKVNGGKCIPWTGSTEPQLGGCDAGFYRATCCRDHKTCHECKSSGYDCGWCNAGSAVNAAQCLPAIGAMEPGYGGCSDGHWDKYHSCPDDVPCGPNCLNQELGKDGCDVKVQNATGQSVGVCTKCKVGFFGENCKTACQKECLSGCDKDHGSCYGCTDGLCGDTCEDKCMAGWAVCKSCDQSCGKCTSCPKGSYDLESKCGKLCGNCNDFDCDDRDGECKGQCLEGWWGMNCDKPCIATCAAPKICANNTCVCGPGYDSGPLGSCTKSASRPSCDTCEKLVEAAKTLTEITKKYATYKEAEEALKAVSCFFLPGPAGIGCAAIIATESLGVFIVSQVSEKLLTAGFCVAWGLCPSAEGPEIAI